MTRPKVAMFVTCLIDNFRPEAGFAAARLLEQSGCEVVVPVQTCCGQPAYNGGDKADSVALARNVIAAFEAFDFVVAPSASCAGTIKNHYPLLFENDSEWSERAVALAAKTHELLSFLVDVRGFRPSGTVCARVCAYHDSCSSLREVRCGREARVLLEDIEGLELREIPDKEVCCGFGGLFSVKYPEVSTRIGDDKIANIKSTGTDLLVGPDLGCLLHLAGLLSRNGETIEVRHAAEILCGMMDKPAIGGEKP
jgi:L-lactate dehydrogenase complex protein LldE